VALSLPSVELHSLCLLQHVYLLRCEPRHNTLMPKRHPKIPNLVTLDITLRLKREGGDDRQRSGIERCLRDIAPIEADTSARHPDLEGSAGCWWIGPTEVAAVASKPRFGPVAPRLAQVRSCGNGSGRRES
jgi:hypothetical protein